MKDLIYRQTAIDALGERPMVWMDSDYEIAQRNQYDRDKLAIETVPPAQPEQRWIPVTLETLPNPNSVVVVCGKKGTWDYGTYRGWHGDIHSWWWKKNTIKHVYWWMYKDDALPEPYREEGRER